MCPWPLGLAVKADPVSCLELQHLYLTIDALNPNYGAPSLRPLGNPTPKHPHLASKNALPKDWQKLLKQVLKVR